MIEMIKIIKMIIKIIKIIKTIIIMAWINKKLNFCQHISFKLVPIIVGSFTNHAVVTY